MEPYGSRADVDPHSLGTTCSQMVSWLQGLVEAAKCYSFGLIWPDTSQQGLEFTQGYQLKIWGHTLGWPFLSFSEVWLEFGHCQGREAIKNILLWNQELRGGGWCTGVKMKRLQHDRWWSQDLLRKWELKSEAGSPGHSQGENFPARGRNKGACPESRAGAWVPRRREQGMKTKATPGAWDCYFPGMRQET